VVILEARERLGGRVYTKHFEAKEIPPEEGNGDEIPIDYLQGPVGGGLGSAVTTVTASSKPRSAPPAAAPEWLPAARIDMGASYIHGCEPGNVAYVSQCFSAHPSP
jgi:hypothetical protein